MRDNIRRLLNIIEKVQKGKDPCMQRMHLIESSGLI